MASETHPKLVLLIAVIRWPSMWDCLSIESIKLYTRIFSTSRTLASNNVELGNADTYERDFIIGMAERSFCGRCV